MFRSRRAAAACRFAALAFVISSAVPASAGAAGQWSSAAPVAGGSGQFVTGSSVGVDRAGHATAIWNGSSEGGLVTADRPAGGSWSAPVTLDSSGQTPDLAEDPAGDAVAVWDDGSDVKAATRLSGGTWSAPVTLGAGGARTSPGASTLALAIDAHGDATAVWISDTGSVVAASLPAGGSWSNPVTLSSTAAYAPTAVAMSPSGDVTAAWLEEDPITNVGSAHTASRSGGGSWSAPATLDASSASLPALGIDTAGTTTAVWSTDSGSGGLVTATLPKGGNWSTPETLDAQGYWGAAVAVDPAGDAAALWIGTGGLDTALRPAGKPWATPTTLDVTPDVPPGSGSDYAVGIDGAGEATAVWGHDDSTNRTLSIETSSGAPAGSWSAPHTLDADTHLFNSSYDELPALAVGPAGDATAVWAHDVLSADPNTAGSTELWASSRLSATKPVASAPPVVSGDATVGSQLSTTDGGWTGCDNGTCTYTVTWMLCPQGSGGCSTAQGDTYTVSGGDVGSTIAACVVATNAAGSSSPDCANAVGPVTDAGGGDGSGGGDGGSGGGSGSGVDLYSGSGSVASGSGPGAVTADRWDDQQQTIVPWGPYSASYASGEEVPIDWSCSDGSSPETSTGVTDCRATIYDVTHGANGPEVSSWGCSPGGAPGCDAQQESFSVNGTAYSDFAGYGPELATACDGPSECEYRLDITFTYNGKTQDKQFYYSVTAPPTAAQQLKLANGASLDLSHTLSGSPALSSGGQYCALVTSLPPGCSRTIFDPSGNPLVTISGDNGGEIIAAGAGNIINAGAHNIIASGAGNIINAGAHNIIAAGAGNISLPDINRIIAAGSGNIIAAGSGNVARVLNDKGETVAIIAAGAGNLKIIAAGAGNILADASGHIIAAGAGNIIAAGAGNIIAAGAGNIIAAGAGNIIAAGAGNLLPDNGFKFGPLDTTMVIDGNPGVGSLGLSASGGGSLATDVATAARRRGVTVGSGSVVFTRPGKAPMTVVLSSRGKRLIAGLAKRNAVLARRHKRLLKIRISLTYTFTPVHGHAVTAKRTFTITPKVAKKRHHRR